MASEVVGTCPSGIHHRAIYFSVGFSNQAFRFFRYSIWADSYTYLYRVSISFQTDILMSIKSSSKTLMDVALLLSSFNLQINPSLASASALIRSRLFLNSDICGLSIGAS